MKKNLFYIAVFVITCFSFITAHGASGRCGENVKWKLDENEKVLTIYGEGEMYDYVRGANIPWDDYRTISEVIVEEGVTSIGSNSLRSCYLMNSLTIPESVVRIGESAFSGCDVQKNIYIQSLKSWCNIEFVNASANPTFAGTLYVKGTALKTLSIPEGVTEIKDYAFYGYSYPDKLILPDSVKSIGQYAFYNSSIESVSFSNNMESIGQRAFYNCTKLTDVYFKGTAEDFSGINKEAYNDPLLNALIHYNSEDTIIVSANAVVKNGKVDIVAQTKDTNAMFFAAGYSNKGALMFCKKLTDGKATVYSDGVDSVKVFGWNSFFGMKPYGESVWSQVTKKAQFVSCKASQTPETQNHAGNVIDGDLSTQWASNGYGNILLDLGEEKSMTSVDVYLKEYNDNRKIYVTVKLSKNNYNWDTIFADTITASDGYKKSIAANGNCRYVLVEVNGSSIGSWCSVTEVEAYCK